MAGKLMDIKYKDAKIYIDMKRARSLRNPASSTLNGRAHCAKPPKNLV